MVVRLPEELIEYILCRKNLDVSDIINFLQTNQYYYRFVRNNGKIWKQKYLQTWPQFLEVLEKNNLTYDWYGEVQYICNLKQRIRKILYLMPSRFYKQYCGDSDFTEWLALYQEKPQTYYYLVDDLMNIGNTHIPINSIDVVPITTPGNKTLAYYAKQALRFLRKLHLTKEWTSLSKKQLTLEKCAIFMIQWSRPNVNVSLKKFVTKLDEFAEEMKVYLKMTYPNHPLFAVSKEKLKMWRDGNIKGNKYGEVHCRQLLGVLEGFCYSPGFSGRAVEEFSEFLKSSLAVQDITMIARESVARRLGLKWQPVMLPGGFILQLSQEYNVEDDDYYDTDINPQDDVLARDVPIYGTKGIFYRLAMDLHIWFHIRNRTSFHADRFTSDLSLYELCRLALPENVPLLNSLADVYIWFNLDCTSLIESYTQKIGQVFHSERLKRIIHELEKSQARRISVNNLHKKVRPPNLKYAVGMVMVNQSNHGCRSLCLCIIYDWYTERVIQDGQPLYKVLLQCGAHQNITQGHLVPVDTDRTDEIKDLLGDIGLHFSHAFEGHFVPNAEKEMEYPDDTAVRHAYQQKIKRGNVTN